jgi:phosphoenolpyruvate phosphomutase
MQNVFARIIADGGIHGADKDIVPVEEIFRLQRMDQIKAAERKFLR